MAVQLAAVMTPPVILNVVVPGLDRWPAATVAAAAFTEPSDSFTWEPWAPPTTCQSFRRGGAESMFEWGEDSGAETGNLDEGSLWVAGDAALNSNHSESIQFLSGF